MNISNFSDYPSLHLPPRQISMLEEVSTVRGSALDIAVITGHVEVVSLLLQHGGKIRNIYYLLRSIALRLQGSFREMLSLWSFGDGITVDKTWHQCE